MISISFCGEFRSGIVGDTVTKDSLRALEIALFIRKRLPVCNVAVRLLSSRNISQTVGDYDLSATEYIATNQSHSASRNSYHLDETYSMEIDMHIENKALLEKTRGANAFYYSLNLRAIKRPR